MSSNHIASVYQQPATTVEDYSIKLETNITSILDELAPFCTSTKRCRKPESCWLPTEVVELKQTRRRLEHKWKSTGSEAVRITYRHHVGQQTN